MTEFKLKPFEKDGTIYGEFFETEKYFLFFGNKNFTKECFSFFPGVQFQLLKQVHGNRAVFIEKHIEAIIEADAQYTSQKNLALAIQTADCLPIFVIDDKQKWITAIHAGWRGVENKITQVSIEKVGRSSNAFNFSVFIGPHIQQDSFEVDKDVSIQLRRATKESNEFYHYHIVRDKYFPGLKKIVKAQLQELPIKIESFSASDIDTFTNNDYESFRRVKGPCRNWSFIYLK